MLDVIFLARPYHGLVPRGKVLCLDLCTALLSTPADSDADALALLTSGLRAGEDRGGFVEWESRVRGVRRPRFLDDLENQICCNSTLSVTQRRLASGHVDLREGILCTRTDDYRSLESHAMRFACPYTATYARRASQDPRVHGESVCLLPSIDGAIGYDQH